MSSRVQLRRRQHHVDRFLLGTDSIGPVVNRGLAAVIVNRRQLDTSGAVQAEIDAARFSSSRDFAACQWKLARFELPESTEAVFNVSAELFKRDDLRRKTNHAVKQVREVRDREEAASPASDQAQRPIRFRGSDGIGP